MAGLNKVLLIGRLTRDPEIRFTPGGMAVCSFSVATSEKWNDKEDKAQEKTEFHNITAFGKLAEVAAEYLKKGSQCFIEGRLQTDKYEKDGVTRYATKVIAGSIQFLDRKENIQEETKPVAEEDIPF